MNQYVASIDSSYAQDKQMIRYLKVILRGTDQNEMYCTLTHLQVFGKSMHLSLKESFKYVNSKNSTASIVPAPKTKTSESCESIYPITFSDFLLLKEQKAKDIIKDKTLHVAQVPKYQQLPTSAAQLSQQDEFDNLPKLIARIQRNRNGTRSPEVKEESKQIAVIAPQMAPPIATTSDEDIIEPAPDQTQENPDEESLETMIKKLVHKVNSNELSQDELVSLSSKVGSIENFLSKHLYEEMQEIRTNITQANYKLY